MQYYIENETLRIDFDEAIGSITGFHNKNQSGRQSGRKSLLPEVRLSISDDRQQVRR